MAFISCAALAPSGAAANRTPTTTSTRLGPGDLGTPQSSTYGGNSWVRHWHGDSPGCLRTWRVHGDIQSNFPCAAFEIWHGVPTEGFGDGDLAWSWLYEYRCSQSGDWTTCRNALGDAYRYRGAYPSVWGGRSGATRGEVAHACDNHAGKLEGDGQYSRLPGSSWNFDGDPTGIVMVRR